MFNRLVLGSIITLALVLCIAAVEKPITQTKDLKIQNTNNQPALIIQKSGTQSSNVLEIWRGGNLELGIPGSNTVVGLKQNLEIQAGKSVTATDGTVTNTFAKTFSSVPTVTVTPLSASTTITTNQVTAVTTSNFVWKAGLQNVTNYWQAIGATQ